MSEVGEAGTGSIGRGLGRVGGLSQALAPILPQLPPPLLLLLSAAGKEVKGF